MKENKICQSCGMPLKADPKGGGTNADGTLSTTYCSYCYQNGAFTFEGTLPEFKEHCRQMMKASGKGGFLAWLFSLGLGRLERWKNK